MLDSTGHVRPAADALRQSDIEPLELAAKEALALVNGTDFMAAIGSILTVRCGAPPIVRTGLPRFRSRRYGASPVPSMPMSTPCVPCPGRSAPPRSFEP